MAITITDQVRLRQENFLDDRQGLASSIESLKNWDFSRFPIPDGFEVFVSGDWYTFGKENETDETTGKFRKRVGEITEDIKYLKEREYELSFNASKEIAETIPEILTEEFWTDKDGVCHAIPGRIVSITEEGKNNGLWYLATEDYTDPNSWIKLVNKTSILTEEGEEDPTIYSSQKSDSLFPKKAGEETISGEWTFIDTAIFTKTITEQGDFDIARINDELIIKKKASFGNTGKIEVVSGGKTVATFNKIVADEVDIEDIDEIIEEKMGLVGVSNLLKNTAFTGQFAGTKVEGKTNLYENTKVYSSERDDWWVTTNLWKVYEEPNSATGYAIKLPSEVTQISQDSPILADGQSYVLSWKQRGEVKVEISGNVIVGKSSGRETLGGYDHYYYKFNKSGKGKVNIRFSGGPGYVCEIKLEEGIVPTAWFPSLDDTDFIADLLNKYEFLKTAFKEYTSDTTVSSLFLKNQIKFGEILDDNVEEVHGGLSGVVNNKKDIIFWSGSDYRSAQALISKIARNPKYLDSLTYPELQSLSKVIITSGFKTIMTDLYAVGKFKGEHLDTNGRKILSHTGVTGVLPIYVFNLGEEGYYDKVYFKNGILDSDHYDTLPKKLVFTNPANLGQTVTIKFQDGKVIGDKRIYFVWTGNSIDGISKLHLLFDQEGYLVKVSSILDFNETYYWF
ncbi:MAG: hypothetical protein J6I84_04990 [Bacilli bacterium]|nr:hypothetical protein [Bacilli bacterium]